MSFFAAQEPYIASIRFTKQRSSFLHLPLTLIWRYVIIKLRQQKENFTKKGDDRFVKKRIARI